MSKILYKVLGVYAAIVFIITMVLVIPFLLATDLFKEPKRSIWFLRFSKIWNIIFIYATGSRIKVTGKEHFTKGETFIIIYNHNSFMDAPISCPFSPAPNKTIARKEFMKIPILNIVYKRGSVLIDRNSNSSKMESYNAMVNVLKKNMHMCIYPEGTRNKTQESLLPFKPGAFRLSIETGKRIIPAIITGTKESFPPTETLYYKPKAFTLTFLEPVSPVGHTEASLLNYCYNVMKAYYEKAQVKPTI
jgi:1-acyl-sn-glycerol-3-phosphate acyltransferase